MKVDNMNATDVKRYTSECDTALKVGGKVRLSKVTKQNPTTALSDKQAAENKQKILN